MYRTYFRLHSSMVIKKKSVLLPPVYLVREQCDQMASDVYDTLCETSTHSVRLYSGFQNYDQYVEVVTTLGANTDIHIQQGAADEHEI